MQPNSLETLLQALRTIVGPAHVLIESADNDLVQYVRDWRGRERGVALAVVRPNSTEQVAAIVKACAASNKAGSGVSIVPQGGNTGMVVGSTPDASGTQIVLSLQRMNKCASWTLATAPSRWMRAVCCKMCSKFVLMRVFCTP